MVNCFSVEAARIAKTFLYPIRIEKKKKKTRGKFKTLTSILRFLAKSFSLKKICQTIYSQLQNFDILHENAQKIT